MQPASPSHSPPTLDQSLRPMIDEIAQRIIVDRVSGKGPEELRDHIRAEVNASLEQPEVRDAFVDRIQLAISDLIRQVCDAADKGSAERRYLGAADSRIADLGFSVRTRKRLYSFGIQKAGDLQQYSAEDLLGIRQFGDKALEEVITKLSAVGLSLKQGALSKVTQAS